MPPHDTQSISPAACITSRPRPEPVLAAPPGRVPPRGNWRCTPRRRADRSATCRAAGGPDVVADREKLAIDAVEKAEVHLRRVTSRSVDELADLVGELGRLRVGGTKVHGKRCEATHEPMRIRVAVDFLHRDLPLLRQTDQPGDGVGVEFRHGEQRIEAGHEAFDVGVDRLRLRVAMPVPSQASEGERVGDSVERRLDHRPGEMFEQSLTHREQACQQIAAVDRRNVGGRQRGERLRVVPVEPVPLVAFELVERVERVLDARRHLGGRQKSEVAGGEARQQVQPNVRRRRPVRRTSPRERLLEVVRRQPVVLGDDERVKEVPRPPGQQTRGRGVPRSSAPAPGCLRGKLTRYPRSPGDRNHASRIGPATRSDHGSIHAIAAAAEATRNDDARRRP